MGSGGKREGSGRPSVDNKKETIAFRVRPEVKTKLKTIAETKKVTISKVVETVISNYVKGE